MSADSDRLDALERQYANLYAEVKALNLRCSSVERTMMVHDEELDTGFRTPLWKKALFVIDGWPLSRLADRPAWRPWHRWWVS